MMTDRQDLQDLLLDLCDNVYFQPPESIKLVYPCIIYKRDWAKTDFAENFPYKIVKRYLVTVVDRDPDSTIPAQVAELRMCVFDRFYTADDLNHDVYKLFF